jgi:hypothetical protein
LGELPPDPPAPADPLELDPEPCPPWPPEFVPELLLAAPPDPLDAALLPEFDDVPSLQAANATDIEKGTKTTPMVVKKRMTRPPEG